ncbi:MAG: hypothetical protein DVB23_002353 [Verrucomicrobia bacterium]|nr:MAG: hypothetical protein DVB23_002353 [Verrucomicrobiota bacterium]
MNSEALKQVLTFQAFRPEPDDPDTVVPQRMAGKKYLCLSISKSRVVWRGVDRKGRLLSVGQADGEFPEILSQYTEEWLGLCDGGWVNVSLNNRFVITLESNLSRKPGTESLLRTNPRAVVGAKYDRSKRYAVYHNPETSASLLLSCEDSLVRSIEDALGGAGFRVMRVSCGLFAMVEDYLRRQHQVGGVRRDFVLIACCEGSACVLSQKKGQWGELRARGGFFSGADIEPVMGISAPLINGSGLGVPIVLLHEHAGGPFASALYSRLESHGAVDVTQPDHLWMVLTQN